MKKLSAKISKSLQETIIHNESIITDICNGDLKRVAMRNHSLKNWKPSELNGLYIQNQLIKQRLGWF